MYILIIAPPPEIPVVAIICYTHEEVSQKKHTQQEQLFIINELSLIKEPLFNTSAIISTQSLRNIKDVSSQTQKVQITGYFCRCWPMGADHLKWKPPKINSPRTG